MGARPGIRSQSRQTLTSNTTRTDSPLILLKIERCLLHLHLLNPYVQVSVVSSIHQTSSRVPRGYITFFF